MYSIGQHYDDVILPMLKFILSFLFIIIGILINLL